MRRPGVYGQTDPPDDLDVRGTRSIVRGDSIDDSDDVALYHPDVVDVAVLLCELQEVLDEVHYIGASIHVILSTC